MWADDVRAWRVPAPDTIRPAKGIHITVPWDQVRNAAAVVPVPRTRRSVFRGAEAEQAGGGEGSVTYISTTSTGYDGEVDDTAHAGRGRRLPAGGLNRSLREPLSESDVLATWAGLRPQVGGRDGRTADLSRRHRVTTSPGGMVTVTGAELTTYREMAQDAVDAAVPRSTTPSPPCPTQPHPQCPCAAPVGAGQGVRSHLAERYGGGNPAPPRGHGGGRPLAGRAAGPQAALSAGRGPMRGPLRDGHHARRRAVPPHPRPAAGPGRHRGRRRRRRHAARRRARLVRARAGRPGALPGGRRAEREAPGLPESVVLAGGVQWTCPATPSTSWPRRWRRPPRWPGPGRRTPACWATSSGLDDATVARSSRLPRWTVGHVPTHLARNADAHVRMLEGAAAGEITDQYEGGAGRSAEIEAGAGRQPPTR